MGQAMQKLTGKEDVVQLQKNQKDETRKLIEIYINEHYKEFESAIKTWDGFYHVVYEIVENLSEKSGAMQFKLPPIDKLKDEFQAVHRAPIVTKDEFRQVIERVITLESFYFGQGAKDIFLYIFGVPILALIVKRIIPGPTRAIPDDVFIPVATTGTVIYLAKCNML